MSYNGYGGKNGGYNSSHNIGSNNGKNHLLPTEILLLEGHCSVIIATFLLSLQNIRPHNLEADRSDGLLMHEKYSKGTLRSPCSLSICGSELTFFCFMQNKAARCFLVTKAGTPPLKKLPRKLPNIGRKSGAVVSSLRTARLVPCPNSLNV